MRKKKPQHPRLEWDRNFKGDIEWYFAWYRIQGEWGWWYFTPDQMPLLKLEQAYQFN